MTLTLQMMATNPSVNSQRYLHSRLAELMQMRPVRTPTQDHEPVNHRIVPRALDAPVVTIPTAVTSTSKEERFMADMQLVATYKTMLDTTGEIEHLNNIIRIVEGINTETPREAEYRPPMLQCLGQYIFNRYERLGAIEDMQRAIQVTEEAVSTAPQGHPLQALMLSNLSNYLSIRYHKLGASEDIANAIRTCKEALARTPADHQDRADRLYSLSLRYSDRFSRSGALEDLTEAIKLNEQAVTEACPNYTLLPDMLNSLAVLLGSRFNAAGSLEDIQNAIQAATEALAISPPGHALHSSILNNLGCSFAARFDQLGALSDLDKAIEEMNKSFTATSEQDSKREEILHDVSQLYHRRYQRLGLVADLGIAIRACEDAVSGTPPDGPRRARRLHSLGCYFSSKFKLLNALEDLDRGIEVLNEAFARTDVNDNRRAGLLYDLGQLYQCRFKRQGELPDLKNAIQAFEETVVKTDSGQSDRGGQLESLSQCLSGRFLRLGAVEDLEKSVRASQEAVAATPADHPQRPNRLSSLGSRLAERFQRLGSIIDINEATRACEEAVKATLPEDHKLRAEMLNNLGSSLSKRYGRLGALEDLDKAIQSLEEAVATTPQNESSQAMMLSNLGSFFASRFIRLGALEDLEKGLESTKESIEISPSGDENRAVRVYNLSILFYSRFERQGAMADLDVAIQIMRVAMEAISIDHPSRPHFLISLSVFHASKFGRQGEPQSLELAIRIGKEAVATVSSSHPRRPLILSILASHLFVRFSQVGVLLGTQDLQVAIQAAEDAVAACPKDDADRELILYRLAFLLFNRYRQTGSAPDFERSAEMGRSACRCSISSPRILIHAARLTAVILGDKKQWLEASVFLERALKTVPRLSPQFLRRDDQAFLLSEFKQLAADTVSISLLAGSTASHCLGLLELGRGIIIGLSIDCRIDLTELQETHPDAFNRFNNLRVEIDSPLSNMKHSFDQNGGVRDEFIRGRRLQAMQEIEESLAYIRQLHGFEEFQLSPSSDSLIAMAAEGPIVVFNTTVRRSDAIIVTSSSIKQLSLQKMVFSDVRDRMEQLARLARGKRSTYPSRNREMEKVLLWLWNVAIEPVFQELQFTAVNDVSRLPRVWWIGVGLLATAPFHAAGNYSPGSTDNTLSRAISSYIPTIKALSYARQKPLQLHDEGPDSMLLFVTMATTPVTLVIPATPSDHVGPATPWMSAVQRTTAIQGADTKHWKPLKNAAIEVDEIMEAVRERSGAVSTRLDSPSAVQVLEMLPKSRIIHFACHAISDVNTPSNSHLVLHGHHLTVSQISNLKIKNGQVAYLSACCTAANPSTAFADESIHIASGFLLAGFSHVLATLWESNDGACRQVAGSFYRFLFNDLGGSDQGHRAVSTAFHQAVKKLRMESLRQPIKWASFIHTGA